jgi:hypothetical protein
MVKKSGKVSFRFSHGLSRNKKHGLTVANRDITVANTTSPHLKLAWQNIDLTVVKFREAQISYGQISLPKHNPSKFPAI